MGKLIAILGGCVVAAAGVSYAVFSHHTCDRYVGCGGGDVVATDCCSESTSCPLDAGAAVSADSCPASAGASSCCASSKAAALVTADVNCCEEAGGCDRGLQALAGAAAFAAKR